ncbi:MAG TPA: VOC family protein [Bacillota bacterium]|nr:VOC family protein [Bacillota bacterium]
MLAIDHVVIAATDPLKSAEQFANKHNLKITQGGKHDFWGTYNVLAYFQNQSYIEWLSIFEQNTAEQSDNPLIQQLVNKLKYDGDGLFQYGLRTTAMDAFIEHFQMNNIPFVGPFQGKRQKPNGEDLTWRMLFPQHSLTMTPFLIEWGQANLYGANPKAVNEQTLNILLNKHENLQLFHHIYQTTNTDQQIPLQNGQLSLQANDALSLTISDD